MFRLIESIRLEQGSFFHLAYHQHRVDRSVHELTGIKNKIDLFQHLEKSDYPLKGLFKCRIIYSDKIELTEFIPYQSKKIESLKLIFESDIDYAYKMEDRTIIQKIYEKRGSCDEVLIVKKGLITDSSNSNIIFFDGTRWVTPDQPLLKGTTRQLLLDANEICEVRFPYSDISLYKKCRLINAMTGFDGAEIDVSQIVP